MAGLVYILCAATALACALLLFRAYSKSGHALLFWSAACFACLTLNNGMLVADRLLIEDVDLSLWRLLPAVAAMVVMLHGLVFHGE
jgi:hypothetical protein